MRWPEIFFKAKPSPARPAATSIPGMIPSPPPEIEPAGTAAVPDPDAPAALPPEAASGDRVPVTAPASDGPVDDSVIREMEEADTLRTMTRSGGVRLVKLNFSAPIPPVALEQAAAARPNGWAKLDEAAVTPDLAIPRDPPKPAPEHPPEVTFMRRRTKMADVARIVLPPRRDEAPSVPSAKAEPAVPLKSTGSLPPQPLPSEVKPKTDAEPAKEAPPIAETPKPDGSSPAGRQTEMFAGNASPSAPTEAKSGAGRSEFSVGQTSGPLREETPLISPSVVSPESPKPEPARTVPSAPGSTPSGSRPDTTLAETREKREFVLSNGERVLGHILSETPDAVYVDHATLGVLTIPRAQVAQRPIEVILINGDRIVGDVVAETSDALFVRHASLGILTVPHKQRSTRVVEAILKDGDRILGEVLGETEHATVIRSATLGTVTVPHNRIAMLNKRAEEIQMKSLPPTTPQVEDKPSS
jgi:RNase P/RNase MRP subunit p29